MSERPGHVPPETTTPKQLREAEALKKDGLMRRIMDSFERMEIFCSEVVDDVYFSWCTKIEKPSDDSSDGSQSGHKT